MRSGRRVFLGCVARAGRAGLGAARDVRGAQLVELALVLPLLLILVVGILDFGTAYNLRQILNNAAREGARVGAAQSSSPTLGNTAGQVQKVCQDVAQYLANARVDTSFIDGTGASPGAGCPGTQAGTVWTVYSSGTYGMEIETAVPILDSSGKAIICTRVTLRYPYSWLYGFNHVIGLISPGPALGTVPIVTDALMEYSGNN